MAQEALNDDILFAPIRDLAERLRTRRLSSVALTEAYLNSEARLLTIAHVYQQATDWHRRRPNLKMR